MPTIPRFGLPQRKTGVPAIDISAEVAPFRAAARLAGAAEEAIAGPAVAMMDKLFAEERKTRQLAFEGQLAKDTANLTNQVQQRVNQLAETGNSDEIHRFFIEELDTAIDSISSRYVNRQEREQALAALTETGASLYTRSVARAVEANIKSAKDSYDNFRNQVIDSVRSGAITVSQAEMKLSDIGRWAKNGSIITDEQEEADIREGLLTSSRARVATEIDKAQTLAADNIGAAIRHLDNALKEVPPDVDASLKEWASAELSRYKSQLQNAQQNEMSQLERIELNQVVTNIEKARQKGMPAAVESQMKRLERLSTDMKDPELRLRAQETHQRLVSLDYHGDAQAKYDDSSTGERIVSGRETGTFSSPQAANQALNNGIDRFLENLGPAGESPTAKIDAAMQSMIGNTNGVIPTRAVQIVGELVSQSAQSPQHMELLVSNIGDLYVNSPSRLTALSKTDQGKKAFQIYRQYRNSYDANLAALQAKGRGEYGYAARSPEMQQQFEQQAKQMTFEQVKTLASRPLKEGDDFKGIEDERRAYANSGSFSELYSKYAKGGFIFDTDFEAAVKSASGMTSAQFKDFIGESSQIGANQVVHEDLLETTKRYYVMNTPRNRIGDDSAVQDALILAAGEVFQRWQMTPNGLTQNMAVRRAPSLQAKQWMMEQVADELVSNGTIPDADRLRVITQDNFYLLGDDNTGYVLLDGPLPVWRATADEFNDMLARRNRKP